jgi:diguanylate cyclase (GGDEF)-like protein
LVRALRSAPSTRHIPVIILTADEAPDLPQKSAVAGSTSFLRKPLNWETLGDHIRHVLELAFRSNHLAFHDQLTRLPNRAFLEPRHGAALAEASSTAIVATYALDLDGFKAVNDTMGHPAGDELLRQVAGRLRGIAHGKDTVARLGGDEFVIIQPAAGGLTDVEEFAQRIVTQISEPYLIDGKVVTVGVSIGIDIAESADRTSSAAIRNADVALYRAKRNGKGQWQIYADVTAATGHGICVSDALQSAIAEDKLHLLYQPSFASRDGRLVELEALIRWQHPELGLILPETILRSAQQSDLLVDLDSWALRRACENAKRWQRPYPVSVNVSLEFLSSAKAIDVVSQVLNSTGLHPGRLTLEFQEDALRSERAAQTLRLISNMSVGLTIDDFGVGACALASFNTLPIKSIKVDQMLLASSLESASSRATLAALTAMSPILAFSTGVIGVETMHSLDLAIHHSIGRLQGFLLGGAIGSTDVDKLEIDPIVALISERQRIEAA